MKFFTNNQVVSPPVQTGRVEINYGNFAQFSELDQDGKSVIFNISNWEAGDYKIYLPGKTIRIIGSHSHVNIATKYCSINGDFACGTFRAELCPKVTLISLVAKHIELAFIETLDITQMVVSEGGTIEHCDVYAVEENVFFDGEVKMCRVTKEVY